MIEKFNIHISDEEINKLHQKIILTRWPDEINDEYWSHGTGMSFLKNLSNEWLLDIYLIELERIFSVSG